MNNLTGNRQDKKFCVKKSRKIKMCTGNTLLSAGESLNFLFSRR